MKLLEIARLFKFVREAGANHGLRVEAIQHWCGGAPGDSWCCEFATMVLDLFFQGNAPIERQGSCADVMAFCDRKGWMVSAPQPGDLFFLVTDEGHAHHIGFVTSTGPLTAIAGNTSIDGASANGDGVYEHELLVGSNHIRFARVPGCG